jgi:hypothetical protein
MAGAGYYLYGLIRTAEDQAYGDIGLEFEGKPSRVYTIRVSSAAAVVSEHAAVEKVTPLRKNLDRYRAVIQELMKTTTIVPVRFGHIAKSKEEISHTLRLNRDGIRRQLDRVDGHVEMGLKVKWDVDNIFEHFISVDAELAALRDQLFGRSSAPSLAEKIELGRLFVERRTAECDRETARVIEMFHSFYTEVKVNPPKNEALVMDLAFLVKREAIKSFEERIYQVAGTFPSHYIFDYTGPWAPFNFVDLDLRTAEE